MDDTSLTDSLLRYAEKKFANGGQVKGYATGGGVTDDDVRSIYDSVLGREAESQASVDWWRETANNNNFSITDLASQFVDSQEAQDQYASIDGKLSPSQPNEGWKTYWGYTPTTKDYNMMLRAGLGEYGTPQSYDQYRALYEAIGNRAAANTIAPYYVGGNKTLAGQITPSQVEGAFATRRINSLMNGSDPSSVEAVSMARRALNDYFTEGQNKAITTQTDWRGFQNGAASPGTGFANAYVPGGEDFGMYNRFYDAKGNPTLSERLAALQQQKNAIWSAPTPEPRPTDSKFAEYNGFTDINPFDYAGFDNPVQPTSLQPVESQPSVSTPTDSMLGYGSYSEGAFGQPPQFDQSWMSPEMAYTDSLTNSLQPNNTATSYNTFQPGQFQPYVDPMINNNYIQQNQLATNASNWQQGFDTLVGGAGPFNMSNTAYVGGYNPTNIGGFDYSGLSSSIGDVYSTPSFGFNTGWDFGGGWGFAEGGKVDFKKMFEGDTPELQQRAREMAREAYKGGLGGLSKEKAAEWEALARKYNLPLTVGPFDNYEDQFSDAMSKWQRNVSPKQRAATFAEGGSVKVEESLAMEELNKLSQVLAGSNPAANVAPFELDLGKGAQARGRVVQAGPYVDVGGGVTLPIGEAMLMLDASYGKVPGSDMKPNIAVKGGLRIPFAEGGAVQPGMGAYDTMTGLVGELPSETAPSQLPRELLEARMSDQARSAMDLSGLALPDRASDVKADEFGSYPVDAEGNRLKFLRRSMVLPMASGDGESRMAMPMIFDIAGNLMSGIAPGVKGSGMVLGSGPVRRGEKKLADLVDEYGVKKPGGNWYEPNVDRRIHDLFLDDERAYEAGDAALSTASNAVNRWTDTKLRGYIKNQMGTVADPLIDVADLGNLHVPSDHIERVARYARDISPFGDPQRAQVGYNPKLIGESDLSRAWEKLTQSNILRDDYGDIINESTLASLPKLPADAKVNSVIFTNSELGFDHLIDELKNAANPNSGLPRNLLIEPEKLERFSMKQAVEHVAKINEWRAKNIAKANEAIANNAATVPFKDYDIVPGTELPNDKGLRWVELKPNEKDEKALEKALKYEGDTMGHCVGGYCPDVTAGKTKIFSLRDKKGQPHVTIEVAKPKRGRDADLYQDLPDDIKEEMLERAYVNVAARISEDSDDFLDVVNDTANEMGRAWMDERAATAAGREMIVQIKGKQNRAPKDDYIPFVQDFVKSKDWSDVRDFNNTGLVQFDPASDLASKIKAAGETAPKYLTQQELTNLLDRFGR